MSSLCLWVGFLEMLVTLKVQPVFAKQWHSVVIGMQGNTVFGVSSGMVLWLWVSKGML